MYKDFGISLQNYRNKSDQSITEVAQAIGVDRSYVSKLENGHERPSIFILNALIGFYALSRGEAFKLSCLAGYNGEGLMVQEKAGEGVSYMDDVKTQVPAQNQGFQLNLNNNIVVIYTDSVLITANQYGLVFDFAQSMGPTNQQYVVSRVGMSKEHAQALLKVLQEKLSETVKENSPKN